MNNLTEANRLRTLLNERENLYKNTKKALENIERQCEHNWSEPKQTTVQTTEFRNGTMIKRGIDFWYERVPYTVDKPAWERICSYCGKKEVTTSTKSKTIQIPSF